MKRRKTNQLAVKKYTIGYCRKSQEAEDKQVHSLEDQKLMIKEHYEKLSKNQRFPLKIFCEAKSAFKVGREYFNTIVKMADNNEVASVIVVAVSRISRNPEDTGKFVRRMVEGQIPYLEVVNGRQFHGEDSGDIFMLTLEGAVSHKDSSEKSKVIAERMKIRAEKDNKWMGRKLFGFKPGKIPRTDGSEERITVVDEQRLPYAIEIFKLAATGNYSLSKLEKWAAERNLRMRPDKNHPQGNPLKKSTIASMLHHPYHKGIMTFHGEETGKTWTDDPPIPVELWNRVQVVMNRRRTNTARAKDDGLRRLFKFGSVIRCGNCSRVLSPYRVKKESGKLYIYYECKNPKTHCQTSIREDRLEEAHSENVKKAPLGVKEFKVIRKRLLQHHNEKSGESRTRRSVLQAEYELLRDQIGQLFRRLEEAKHEGVEDEVRAEMQKLKDRRDHIQVELNRDHAESTEWIDRTMKCFELLNVAQELLNHGSPSVRAKVLEAVASNYELIEGKLVCDLRSPFKEASTREGLPEWWS